jgi:hypothetical protein
MLPTSAIIGLHPRVYLAVSSALPVDMKKTGMKLSKINKIKMFFSLLLNKRRKSPAKKGKKTKKRFP